MVRKKRKGFFMLDLLIAVSLILVMLGYMASVLLGKSVMISQGLKAQADIMTLVSALHVYYSQNVSWPSDLSTLVPNYLAVVPTPPWGGHYGYTHSTNYCSITVTAPDEVSLQQIIKLLSGTRTGLTYTVYVYPPNA